MKILISTLGSRGDVQPYLALGVGLQKAGHKVMLAAPETFAGWIREYGVETVPIGFNPQEAMRRLGQRVFGLGNLHKFLRILRDGMEAAQDQTWRAAAESDFLIQSATGMGALEVRELHGIPSAYAHLFPFTPTRSMPMFWLPFRFSLGPAYNLLTYAIMTRILWLAGGRMANGWRRRLGLPAARSAAGYFDRARSHEIPYLMGYSPSLIPKPDDWGPEQHVTGYWFLDEPAGWQPPAALERFLDSGPPPVYIGFGSMHHRRPEKLAHTVLSALKMTGQRGVLHTGWGGLARLPDSADIFYLDEAPHAWLFPRMAAVVHHGGAGTTAAGLRAGVPGIFVPFGGDQFSWADQVEKAGAGVRAGSVSGLNARKLAAALDRALEPDLRSRAEAVGRAVRKEKGVAVAVAIIEQYASKRGSYSSSKSVS